MSWEFITKNVLFLWIGPPPQATHIEGNGLGGERRKLNVFLKRRGGWLNGITFLLNLKTVLRKFPPYTLITVDATLFRFTLNLRRLLNTQFPLYKNLLKRVFREPTLWLVQKILLEWIWIKLPFPENWTYIIVCWNMTSLLNFTPVLFGLWFDMPHSDRSDGQFQLCHIHPCRIIVYILHCKIRINFPTATVGGNFFYIVFEKNMLPVFSLKINHATYPK